MKNAFEAGRIAFTIDGANLIRKKYIIEEMAVEGVRLNTQRKSSGAIGRAKKGKGPEEEALKLLTFELPEVDEVIKKEKIESIKEIEGLNKEVKADRENFEKELKALPDEKKIREYERRIAALKGSRGFGGIVGGAGEALALKNEIQADLKRVAVFKDTVAVKTADYRKRVEAAALAPGRDVQKIVSKYSISPEGLKNLGSLFVGGRVREWVENGLEWREKLDRIVSREGKEGGAEVQKSLRGRGVDVQFHEYRPLPDFLIRKASVSFNIPSGDIAGAVTNITGDQDILGSPMRIRFYGERLKGLTSALLEGEINRVAPESPRDIINFSVKGYRLHDLLLTDNEYMTVALKEALADFDLNAEVKGGMINGHIGSAVRSALTEATVKAEKNPMLDTIAAAFSDVKAFNIDAKVDGKLDAYGLSVSSDLDRVLSGAVGGALRDKVAAFESGMRGELLEKTAEPLKELNGSFKGLIDVNGIAGERLKKFDELLAEAARGVIPLPKLGSLR